MQAMIFAAGLGTRLKPWTDSHPKALVPVHGQPVLRHVIEHIAGAGIGRIVINVHHFADQIEDYIRANDSFGLDILISDERDLLRDTGGGLRHAAELLHPRYGDVLVHNADIYSDVDLSALCDAHAGSHADVTLAVADRKSSRKLIIDADNNLAGWRNLGTGETRPATYRPDTSHSEVAFSGIHILRPEHVMPQLVSVAEDVFGIIPFYLDRIETLAIHTHRLPSDTRWYDIGRPESLAAANA